LIPADKIIPWEDELALCEECKKPATTTTTVPTTSATILATTSTTVPATTSTSVPATTITVPAISQWDGHVDLSYADNIGSFAATKDASHYQASGTWPDAIGC